MSIFIYLLNHHSSADISGINIFGLFFPFVDPLTEITIKGTRAMVSEQTGISVSRAKSTESIAMRQIVRYKNKQDFSDF